jgi:hypothetical protein
MRTRHGLAHCAKLCPTAPHACMCMRILHLCVPFERPCPCSVKIVDLASHTVACVAASPRVWEVSWHYGAAGATDGWCMPCCYRYGCTSADAINFDSLATIAQGCRLPIPGCLDSLAENYAPDANVAGPPCSYKVFGCTFDGAANYDSAATRDDGMQLATRNPDQHIQICKSHVWDCGYRQGHALFLNRRHHRRRLACHRRPRHPHRFPHHLRRHHRRPHLGSPSSCAPR